MKFRVELVNEDNLCLTLFVDAICDSDACKTAAVTANSDPYHSKYGPWVSGYSTRKGE